MGNNVVSILQHITTVNRNVHDRVFVIGDRVFYFADSNVNPWIELSKVDDSFMQMPVGMVGVKTSECVEIGEDVEDLMRYLHIPVDTEYYVLTNVIEIGQFIDQLTTGNDEAQHHQSYFTMVNEVGERYKLAVDAVRDVMIKIGRRQASLDSVSYLDAIRELSESSRAFEALVTSVAAVEFTKE